MSLITNVVKGSTARRLLLLVHGFGADEVDLGGVLPYLDPDGEFAAVMPRAPHPAPGTPGYMWYDMLGGGAAADEQFATALAELDTLVDEQCDGARVRPGDRGVRRLLAGCRPGARARPVPLACGPTRGRARAEPRLPRRRARRTGGDGARADPARHQRSADPRAAVAGSRARPAGRSGCRPCTASTRWSTRSRSRACGRARDGSRSCVPASDPTSRCPTILSSSCRRSRPRSGKPEVLQQRASR